MLLCVAWSLARAVALGSLAATSTAQTDPIQGGGYSFFLAGFGAFWLLVLPLFTFLSLFVAVFLSGFAGFAPPPCVRMYGRVRKRARERTLPPRGRAGPREGL